MRTFIIVALLQMSANCFANPKGWYAADLLFNCKASDKTLAKYQKELDSKNINIKFAKNTEAYGYYAGFLSNKDGTPAGIFVWADKLSDCDYGLFIQRTTTVHYGLLKKRGEAFNKLPEPEYIEAIRTECNGLYKTNYDADVFKSLYENAKTRGKQVEKAEKKKSSAK